MTQLISPDDPQYFEVSSDGFYDRHQYKIVSKSGDAVVVDDWESARLVWFSKSPFLSHVEVLDKKEVKGFK
jgi:hypothetical protein